MPETPSHFSHDYQTRIRQDYGDLIGDELQRVQYANLPEQPGESIGYLRFNANAGDEPTKPVLFVYGFLAGVVANAPFGAAMAARGYDIIIPDQNRQGLLRNVRGKKDATHSQAANLVAIIASEGLTNTPLDVVTHSYGSLIFDDLQATVKQQHWSCFDESSVAMLAPAGIRDTETTPKFIRRWLKQFSAGKDLEKFPDSYWSFSDEMAAPAIANVKVNPLRALREGLEVAKRRTNLGDMLQNNIGKIALIPFAEDVLYPAADLSALPLRDDRARVTMFSPISLADRSDGLRSGRGADHSDHQFNPERVAAAVDQFMRA